MRRAAQPCDVVLDLVRPQTDRAEREPDAVSASQHLTYLERPKLGARPLEAPEHEQQGLAVVMLRRHGCDASSSTVLRVRTRRVRPLNKAGTM